MTNHSYISIKKSLIDELNRIVPFAERQQFVEEVLTRELRRRRLRFALKKSYGAWKDEDHPELTSYEDVNSWVESIRKKDKPTLNEHNSI
ncbi:MAG: hypothetical protein FJ031_10370 [Chloroflexi bacterium]|nr:hypothetical protein [Chloroflexota bacterium]